MKRKLVYLISTILLAISVSGTAVAAEIPYEMVTDYSTDMHANFLYGDYSFVSIGNKTTIIGPDGKAIYKPGLYSWCVAGQTGFSWYMQCGNLVIVTGTNGKVGIIDLQGHEKVKPKYSRLTFLNNEYSWVGLAWGKGEGAEGVVRISDGKELFRSEGQKIELSLDHQYFVLTNETTGKVTIRDLEGNLVAGMAPPKTETGDYYYHGPNINSPAEPDYSKILHIDYSSAIPVANGAGIIEVRHSGDTAWSSSALYDIHGNEIIPFGQCSLISGSNTCNYIYIMRYIYGKTQYALIRLPGGDVLPPEATADIWAQPEIKQAIDLSLLPADMLVSYQKDINKRYFCNLMVGLYDKLQAQGLVKPDTVLAKTVSFTDVPDSDPAVLKAAQLGIVNGNPDGTFRPDASISRQDAAVMLYRLALCVNPDVATVDTLAPPNKFADTGSIDAYAKEAVAFVSAATDNVSGCRIMQGNTKNQFDPRGLYTRERAFLTVLRIYRYLSCRYNDYLKT